jgi:hypothetical protein
MRVKQKITYSMKDPIPQLSGDVNKWFKEEYQHLADTLCDGDKFAVTKLAKNEQLYLSEYLRALYVLQATGSFAELPKYSISYDVYKDILINYKQIDLPNSSEEEVVLNLKPKFKSKRQDKYEEVTQWCKDNAGKKVKVKDVSDLVEWSYPTANTFVQSRPDLFSKFSHGVYLLKNPDEERIKEKNKIKNGE